MLVLLGLLAFRRDLDGAELFIRGLIVRMRHGMLLELSQSQVAPVSNNYTIVPSAPAPIRAKKTTLRKSKLPSFICTIVRILSHLTFNLGLVQLTLNRCSR